MTPLRKLELGAGLSTLLIAYYLMRSMPDAMGLAFYGVPSASIAIGACVHSTRRAPWAQFLLGLGVFITLGVFVFLFLILAFHFFQGHWFLLNLILIIVGLVSALASLWTHSEAL